MKPFDDPKAAVRAYYEQNTGFFTRFGGSAKTHSIHRSLWPPGVTSLEQALNQSNRLVLEAIQGQADRQAARPFLLADLGCGVGGTLIFLLKQLQPPSLGFGLTISPLQARMAQAYLRRNQLSAQARIVEGDFLALPLQPGFDALVSIEAFAHAPDPRRYLAEAVRVLRPGGRLVLVDDFLPTANPPAEPEQQAWLQAYRAGWRVPGLSALADLVECASALGLDLCTDLDLTAWLRLRTLPNRLTRVILTSGARLPQQHALIPSMLGSLALQHCLKARVVEYHLLVFEKRSTAARPAS